MTPSFATLLEGRAAIEPGREAVSDLGSGERHGYGDIAARGRRVAAGLARRAGVRAGDRVALLARNGTAYLDLLLGLEGCGAILVPLNWRCTVGELAFVLDHCRPRAVVWDPAFAGTVAELRERTAVARWIPLVRGADSGAELAHDELVVGTDAPPMPARAGAPGNPACILYTSGTTGRPKGAVIPHRQVTWNAVGTALSWGLRESDATAVLTPMFHAGGLFALATPLLAVGGRVVLVPDFDPDESLRILARERCTVVLAVPTILRMWLDAPALGEVDLGAVRWIVTGGAPCPPDLAAAAAARGLTLRQGYGMTEVGVNCFATTDAVARRKPQTVGRPVVHGRIRIVDEQGRDVEDGETGELLLAGPHVGLGYWQDPEATAEAIRDGWFHTGNLARRDAEGDIAIVGRKKDMIISGGENVYAAEVEAVFREHPSVADAALIGRPDPTWGEVGWMAVVSRRGCVAEPGVLLEHARARLARYKVPKRVLVRDRLPYAAYGKVIKAELRAEIDGELDREFDRDAPGRR